MPERAEIAHMANCLHSEIAGMICNYVLLHREGKFFDKGLYSSCQLNYQYTEYYSYINFGMLLNCVTSRGKKIIFDFGTFRFVSACLMNGRWSFTKDNQVMITLIFSKTEMDLHGNPTLMTKEIYYSDSRFGGNFSICAYPSLEYEHVFKDVGPDLLTNEVDFNVYRERITNTRLKTKKISEFMMDQKQLSGVGNWLRAEILYFCRINPHRQLMSLSETDIYNLFYYTKYIIFTALEKKGLTLQSYLDPYGNTGTYECYCYGRDFDPYGNPINSLEKDKDGRRLHWCPNLQI